MTYADATEKVVQAFFELSDEKQVEMIEQHIGDMGNDVDIFPMLSFDAYCKNQWKDDYSGFAETLLNSQDNFNLSDEWCMYNKSEDVLESAETPADFAFSDDALADTLLSDTDFLLDELGLDWSEINEMKEAIYGEE